MIPTSAPAGRQTWRRRGGGRRAPWREKRRSPARRTARRTGQAQRAVRYVPRRLRVCVRHGRWLLDADADQPLQHLDLRGVPEAAAAQRQWAGVARRAVRAAAEPGQVSALAHAVVAR
ncbi:hypothetical protein ACFY0F_26270 [Streptomyces sp. NPDC001544]|uniref:hypothetical protein n=1 Tax=Streptomyces sp. NPDC001544 TaxID=3364584 RepID=UPI00369D8D04